MIAWNGDECLQERVAQVSTSALFKPSAACSNNTKSAMIFGHKKSNDVLREFLKGRSMFDKSFSLNFIIAFFMLVWFSSSSSFLMRPAQKTKSGRQKPFYSFLKSNKQIFSEDRKVNGEGREKCKLRILLYSVLLSKSNVNK